MAKKSKLTAPSKNGVKKVVGAQSNDITVKENVDCGPLWAEALKGTLTLLQPYLKQALIGVGQLLPVIAVNGAKKLGNAVNQMDCSCRKCCGSGADESQPGAIHQPGAPTQRPSRGSQRGCDNLKPSLDSDEDSESASSLNSQESEPRQPDKDQHKVSLPYVPPNPQDANQTGPSSPKGSIRKPDQNVKNPDGQPLAPSAPARDSNQQGANAPAAAKPAPSNKDLTDYIPSPEPLGDQKIRGDANDDKSETKDDGTDGPEGDQFIEYPQPMKKSDNYEGHHNIDKNKGQDKITNVLEPAQGKHVEEISGVTAEHFVPHPDPFSMSLPKPRVLAEPSSQD